jgi:predicted nucleotidyltransferase component of viral defense system
LLTRETKEAWDAIRQIDNLLNGFVLIGGTALALHIQHRFSEDLDFAFVGTKLPRDRIHQILSQLEQRGFKVTPNDNPAALDDFSSGGEDLHDYHQDYIVNDKVKLTFVCPDHTVHKVLGGQFTDPFRIASIDEIFKLKCLVTAQRSKSRDWLDLYTLFTQHNYTVDNLRSTFAAVGQLHQADIALARLCACKTLSHDEGYAQLAKNPPSTQEMASFFQQELKKNEVALARATLLEKRPKAR